MVQVGLLRLPVPHAIPQIHAGDLLGVPGEVLATTGLVGGTHTVLPEYPAHRLGGQIRAVGVVHHRRNTLRVLEFDADAVGRGEVLDGFPHEVLDRRPHVAVRATQRAQQLRVIGDHVRGITTGMQGAPGQHGARARVETTVEDRREPGGELGGREDGVLGLVRTRSVTTVGLESDPDLGVGGGDRPGRHAHLAHPPVRIAVQGEDAVHVLDHPFLHAVLGAAGHGLLCRLEDQPHGPGRRVGDQQFGRAEQHRRVGVVAAGVRHPLGT